MKTRNPRFSEYFLIQIRALGTGLVLILFMACENFVEVPPPQTELVSSTVFENERTATSVMTGIYSRMMESFGFAGGYFYSITVTGGLSADELVSYGTADPFYENTLLPGNSTVTNYFWNEPYQYIYTANTFLEGLSSATGISEAVRRQLEGEARFIRAFCYFYLVNYFGDVPLHLTSDYRENGIRPRSPATEVYRQIITDLKEAQNLLSEDYSFSDGERTRPNKWVATAMLARVYLYTEDWAEAEEEASKLISNSTFKLSADLNETFLKNSKETIWQLTPVRAGFNTLEAFRFILISTPPTTQGLSEQLLNAFETGDTRKTVWIGQITDSVNTWYYPYKYKIRTGSTLTEYSMVLRLAEQYLIRAEARAQQGDITGARKDLNVVRNRSGLENITATTQTTLLDAVLHERQVELFAEWGHRWFDLKRTGRANTVLGAIKPQWKPTAILYPIPLDELLRNPEIIQNPGY